MVLGCKCRSQFVTVCPVGERDKEQRSLYSLICSDQFIPLLDFYTFSICQRIWLGVIITWSRKKEKREKEKYAVACYIKLTDLLREEEEEERLLLIFRCIY